MKKDLSFESACQIVKGEYPELVNDIDKFSSIVLAAGTTAAAVPIALAVGPTIVTPAAIILTAVGTLSNLLGVKNEISAISENIIAKIASKRDRDTLKLFERMQQAFSLTCYTSFFEALNQHEHLSPLLEKIKVTGEEKHRIAVNAAKDLLGRANMQIADAEIGHVKFEIDLPQPGDTFQTQRRRLLPLYQQLAKRIENFFELEIIKKQVQESGGQDKIERALREVPEKAIEYFKAQYYGLAMKYPEFAIWLNLQESEKSRTQSQEVAEYSRKLIDLAENGQKAIDIGFRHMEEVIKSIPLRIEQGQTDTVLQRLETWYMNTIEKPIIDDPYNAYTQPTLTYPKKSDIFIPQAFQVLHYTGEEHLEREQTWKGLPERNDLSAFLLGYFNHPICIHKPLIILGQPGSGKSLLTSMLAARLIASASSYTPIKVELRHVNTEASIPVQVKDQVYKDTALERSWGELANCSVHRPPLVLFDGYDELLQATGKVFSGYLKDVEAFQEDELTRRQTTVRAIVTSRINLIDKAVIPKHATIIRLLKFNTQRQDEWISRWNNANAIYFEQAQVKPLTLPQENKSIKQLAEQPLLLMMLAIYDSVGNPLLSTKDLDQTLLYNELLRRFIERELKKDEKVSRSWQKEELDKAVDHEMGRLGAAAIGMFNRRRLYVQKEDLDADLKFFDPGKSSLEIEGRRFLSMGGRDLLPAEKMFGSFFFQQLTAVHRPVEPESIELATVYKPQETESDIAYEFLHNTFGEFLTADFMLRKMLEETAAIHYLTGVKILRSTLSQKIEQLDGLEPGWFARFMYTPLFSRPIIVNLLREWSRHLLKQERQDIHEVLADLDTIITNHINLLLTGNILPSLMIRNDQRPFTKLPVIGHFAIYTLNLILLRTLLAPDSFTFDETKYTPSEDGTRAWDRLTYLWRSWFSLETLNELAAILSAERVGTKIRLKIKNTASTSSNRNRLDLVHSVSQALADNITAGLSGLLLHDSFRADQADLDVISKILHSEQIDKPLLAVLFTKQLRHLRHETRIPVYPQALVSPRNELDWTYGSEASVSLLAEIVRLAQETDDQQILTKYRDFVLPPDIVEESDELTRETIRLAKETEYDGAIRYFGGEYILHIIAGKPLPTRRLAGKPLPTRRLAGKPLSAELLTELIQVASGKGISIIADYIKQEYLEKARDGHLYIPPRLAVEMIKFARRAGDQSILGYFLSDYMKLMPNSQKRMTIELTVEIIKLAHEIGDQKTLSQFIEMCIRTVKRNKLGEDTFVNYTLFTELLKCAHEINNHQVFMPLVPYIIEMMREDKYLLPEAATAILKFAHKVNDRQIMDIYSRHYLTGILQTQQLVPVELAVELIKLALEEQDTSNQAHIKSFYHKNVTVERCHLEVLPLGTVMDIRHLAQIFSDNNLVRQINTRLRL